MCLGLKSSAVWAESNTFLRTTVAQMVKNLPAIEETRVRSLGREDPLEKGMATHFSNLAWRIPWTEMPGGLQSMGSQRVRQNWVTNTQTKKQISERLLLCRTGKLGWSQGLLIYTNMLHLLEKKVNHVCYYCFLKSYYCLLIALFLILDYKFLESMD